jgi:hypothetical protein
MLTPLNSQRAQHDFSGVDEFAQQIGFSKDYLSIVEKIQDRFEEDVLVTRAIFSWIVEHISYNQEVLDEFRETGKRGKTSFEGTRADVIAQQNRFIDEKVAQVLKTRRGVCQDYAWLFQRMAEAAELEVAFIRGFGRFNPSNIGKEHAKGNHAWNAIKLNGEWELIDVTWSTGMGFENKAKIGYFMTPPEIFIHSHHPSDERWQLLDQPIDVQTFSRLSFIHSYAIEFGLQDFLPREGYVSARNENEFQFSMGVPIDKVFIIDGKNPIPVEKEVVDGKVIVKYRAKRPVSRPITIGTYNGTKILPLFTYKMKT